MAKLTKKHVDALIPLPQAYFDWDDKIPGFGVRVMPSGVKSWQIQFKRAGRTRRMSLGLTTVLTPEKARDMAKGLMAEVAQGHDPVGERHEALHAPTVSKLVEMYQDRHAPKKKASSLRNDKSMLAKHILPALGRLKVAKVRRADLAKLHNSLRETPYAANRCLALCSKLFSLAEKWGLRPDGSNPCRHVERFKEQPRKRYLSADELARLGAALAQAEGSESLFALAAIRLLLLTGARLNEVLALRWEHVDLERGCLHLPDSKTGQKEVMLNPPALQVLASLPRVDLNPFVIVGARPGSHWVNLNKPWRRLRAAAGIPDARIHDLRHSHAAIAAGLGLGLPIIGGLLGHTQAATTQRYAHLANDPLRAASAAVGECIAEALAAPVDKKVVPICRK